MIDLTLRVAVLSKFHSIKDFADAMHWSPSKALRIINKKQNPTDIDIDKMAKVLEIQDFETFMKIFFDRVYTTCTKKSA